MKTFILILVFTGSGTAALSIPGFKSEADCLAAATKVVNQIANRGTNYSCVVQP